MRKRYIVFVYVGVGEGFVKVGAVFVFISRGWGLFLWKNME